MNNIDTLIENITQAINFKYSTDATGPGLLISFVKDQYYASIVRYKKPFAKEKVVVCKAYNATLPGVLEDLASKFLDLHKETENPVTRLQKLVGNKKTQAV